MALVLLDSASLYFRAYFALPDSITAPDGTPVNAVRGFADMVARVLVDRRPSRLVACLDADWRPAFRVAALPSYKAHRVAESADDGSEQVPDTLTVQVPIILDMLRAAGLAIAEADGHEADDVIGTLVARETVDPVDVVTGDRDLFQVVRRRPTPARVSYVGRGWAKAEVLGPAELAVKYALPSANAGRAYADMAVLRGDPSDGLPGVPGVGEKTAARLISQFGSLEALLAAVDGSAGAGPAVPARTRAKLIEAADYLRVAPGVVRVVTDAPVVMDRSDIVPDGPADPGALARLRARWGLGSSIDRLVAALEGSR
ncbi:MAG TPA: 5'-3' exonuclease [Pseudonocardiaceae bacterium]